MVIMKSQNSMINRRLKQNTEGFPLYKDTYKDNVSYIFVNYTEKEGVKETIYHYTVKLLFSNCVMDQL